MALREYDYEKEPVVSIVKKILTDAVKMKASDIHFDPTNIELSIKFRINGNLQEYTTAPESVKTNITTRIKILSGMNITDSMHPQTGGINFESEGKTSNMRVSSLPVCYGEKIVIHITNYENNIKSLTKIGINPEDTEKIKKLLKNNQGIILITGTSASGKTTTMYSMLKELNSKAINIISIEDPVKLKLEGIHQVEIAPDKGLTYKSAIKHTLLQDPNIICIDNLIDDEITREVIRASITGRLVISSLYTKNAYTTIDTLLNMDIENYLLGSNINGIISQRLVKRLCPHCKEKKKATEYEKTVIKKILNKDIEELYYPKGCEECQGGYINQIPIVEVIEITDEIKSAITNKKDRKTIRTLLYENNNTIIIDGFNRALEGETTFNEIIRIIDVKSDFTDQDKEIKEYILGNGAPTTKEILTKEKDEQQQTKTVIEEKKKEVTEAIPVTNEIKEEPKDQIIEESIKEEKEEYNVLEDILMEEPEEEKEINVPTPIEANVVEEKENNTNTTDDNDDNDDDDDDDDDFNYGGYENNF